MTSKKTLMLKTAKQVRALRTPVRQGIVETFLRLGECTVGELAAELGREPATLYYHVHALEKAGIVLRSKKLGPGGGREARYRPAATRIKIDRTVKSRAFLDALEDLQRATMRTAEREVMHAGRKRGAKAGNWAPPMLYRTSARLSPGAKREFEGMLRELVGFLAENDDPDLEETHALTIAFARTR